VTPELFFRTLYRHHDDGVLTLFSIGPDKTRRTDWYDANDIAALCRDAQAMTDRDVWFGVATRQRRLSDGRRGGDADCLEVPGLWLDIDIAGPNHKDSYRLPLGAAEAHALIGLYDLDPSFVVNSGGGLHAYWLFDEPINASDAGALLARWAATWAELAHKAGLRVDNVFDIARVLRVPGTYNQKNGAHKPVTIDVVNKVRYPYSELHDHTIDPPTPTRHDRRVPYTGQERPGDDFNARHPGGYVLSMAGWTYSESTPAGDEKWLHPWSPTSDCSATVYADDGHTTVWSDTAVAHCAGLNKHHPYDPFGLYAALMHDGDFAEAARQLSRDGYGNKATTITDDERPAIDTDTGKPYIYTNGRHLDDLTNDVVSTLLRLNDPPTMFRFGDSVAGLAGGQLEPIDRVRLMNTVEIKTRPVSLKKDGPVPSRVDATALELSLIRLLDELPVVNTVMQAPFLRPDGTVCVEAGYDQSSSVYLASTMPLTLPTRHLVPLAPMMVLDGNGPGVGKNLLSECCVYVATGEWVQTDPLPLDNEEQRKQITSLLATGRSVALFDEAHIIGGTSLARLITSTTWGDRLLGYSKNVSYPNNMSVIALGNNVEVTGDLPRRCIVVRLSSNLSRPDLRSGFRHDDLRAWVTVNRARLLEALLTILRAWVAAGRPSTATRLGSFDAWAAMIGGALEVAGVAGFLSNAEEMRSRSATDDTDMTAHLEELSFHVGDTEFGVRRVVELFERQMIDVLPPKVGSNTDRMAQQLGHVYRRYCGRWMGECQLVAGAVGGGSRRWRIERRPDLWINQGDLVDSGDSHSLRATSIVTVSDGATTYPAERGTLNSSPTSPTSPPTGSSDIDAPFDDPDSPF
jgi:hypothetical protein